MKGKINILTVFLIINALAFVFLSYSSNSSFSSNLLELENGVKLDTGYYGNVIPETVDPLSGKIFLVTPTSPEEIKFEVLEKTDSMIIMKMEGVDNLIIEGESEYYFIYGEIEYIIFEQPFINGEIGSPYLKSLEGDTKTLKIEDVEAFLKSGNPLFGILEEGECEEDEDCEKILPTWPGMRKVCENGVCRYRGLD
ncbi:hypothetical protein AMJ80_03725 [bacterium SM23_31]|nr:MAG: hypothetical protein AMJ80_03725 [bacterium SM23_31]